MPEPKVLRSPISMPERDELLELAERDDLIAPTKMRMPSSSPPVDVVHLELHVDEEPGHFTEITRPLMRAPSSAPKKGQ